MFFLHLSLNAQVFPHLWPIAYVPIVSYGLVLKIEAFPSQCWGSKVFTIESQNPGKCLENVATQQICVAGKKVFDYIDH